MTGLLKMFTICVIAAALAGCSSSRYGNQMEAYNTPPSEMAAFDDTSDAGIDATARESKLIDERGHNFDIVEIEGDHEYNTVIVVTDEHKLYVTNGDGTAIVFPIAVGKEGFAWSGESTVGLKKVNPTWTPPAEMIERRPELEEWAKGMPGGPENPLGVRALYLYDESGEDTLYRIHGTNAPETIGTDASSGCIRMYNQHVTLLYSRLRLGDRVIVTQSRGEDVASSDVDTDEYDYE